MPIGIGVTAATVAVLAAGFFHYRRQQPLPVHGWLGLFALAGAEWLMFRGVEPVATYFTPIVWSAYILIADAAVLALVAGVWGIAVAALRKLDLPGRIARSRTSSRPPATPEIDRIG